MSVMNLPVLLERLSPEARSWVISKSASMGVSPEAVAREALEQAASRDGFVAEAAQPELKEEQK